MADDGTNSPHGAGLAPWADIATSTRWRPRRRRPGRSKGPRHRQRSRAATWGLDGDLDGDFMVIWMLIS